MRRGGIAKNEASGIIREGDYRGKAQSEIGGVKARRVGSQSVEFPRSLFSRVGVKGAILSDKRLLEPLEIVQNRRRLGGRARRRQEQSKQEASVIFHFARQL